MALNHGKGWRFHSIFVCYNRWDDVYTEYFALRFYITFKKSSHYFKMQGHFRPLFLFLFISVQLKVNKTADDCNRNTDLCGQSYKACTIVNYDSRVVPDLKIPHITTLIYYKIGHWCRKRPTAPLSFFVYFSLKNEWPEPSRTFTHNFMKVMIRPVLLFKLLR